MAWNDSVNISKDWISYTIIGSDPWNFVIKKTEEWQTRMLVFMFSGEKLTVKLDENEIFQWSNNSSDDQAFDVIMKKIKEFIHLLYDELQEIKNSHEKEALDQLKSF